MALTEITYTGTGGVTFGPIPFPYLEESDVLITINGTVTTAFTIDNSTKIITFSSAPANGSTIRVYRNTNNDTLAATFVSGSAIRAADLNDNFTQNLYVIQEIDNNAIQTDGSKSMVGNLNMGSNRITNLATPVAGTDAVNRSFVEGVFSSEVPFFYRRWSKTAVGGETSLSGNDNSGIALSYVPGSEKVFINGALQVRGVDYTGTTGTTLTAIPALTAGDIVEVHSSSNYLVGTVPDGSVTNAKVDGGAGIQSTKLAFTQAGTGATTRTVDSKLRDVVSVKDFGAVGDGVVDDTAAINAALAASSAIYFPPGTYITTGNHNIQGKTLIGFDRYSSIIKAAGSNSGVTIFRGAQASPSSPGTWGSGGAFTLERLGIHGNWNGTSGLTLVGNYKVGVLSASYNATNNTALVKGVSTVYTQIRDCQITLAYEHAVMFYGNGYSEISGNIISTNRGSGIWMAGDSSSPASTNSSTSTSTTFEDNQIVVCRGESGALIMNLTYGCAVRGNLFEANNYGYNLGEGADCSFSGNYSELGYVPNDDIGVAPVLIASSIWGYSFVSEAYNPTGDYVPAAPRSAVVINRSGVRICGTPGYGGAGVAFPAVQAPSANANTLDDYEEGTWTPSGFGITFSSASGKYTKIGNLVTVQFTVAFPVTTNGNIAYIIGLPFTPGIDSGVAFGATGGRTPIDFTYSTSTGNPYLVPVAASGATYMTNANFSGGTLVGTCTYFI